MRKRAWIPLLLAWVIILGIVAYVATHPRLVAPYASRLLTRNLLRGMDADLHVRDFRLHYLQGIDLFHVSLTIRGERGAVTLVAADTVSLNYEFAKLFQPPVRLLRLTVIGCELYANQGDPNGRDEPPHFKWPWLSIDQVEIRDSFLEISGPDGRLRERVPTFSWRGAVRADSVLALDCRDAEIDWETHRSRLSRVYGQVEIGDSGVRFHDLHARVNESQVAADGWRRWNGDMDLALQGQDLVVSEVEDLLDMRLDFAAAGDMEANFRSRADSLTIHATFTGEMEGYRCQDLRGHGVLTPGRLEWLNLEGGINDAYFSGTGEFDLSDPRGTAFTLSGGVADVDLAQGLIPDEELPSSDGHGYLNIFHSEQPQRTEVQGILYDGFIATIPFDTCRVNVLVNPSGVVFHPLELRRQGQLAILTGQTDTASVFTGYLTVTTPDLATLPAEWGWPDMKGRLRMEGEVHGLEEHFDFHGHAQLEDVGLDPLHADLGEVNVAINDVLGVPEFMLAVQGEGLSVGGVPLGNYRLRGIVSAAGARLDLFQAQLGDTSVSVQGHAVFTDTLSRFDLNTLSIDLEGNRWEMTRPTTLVLGPEHVVFPAFELASEHGLLSLRDLERHTDRLAGSLRLQRFDLGLLNPFLAGETRLSGEVTADLALTGTPDDPGASLAATVTDCDLTLARIDSLYIAAAYRQGGLQITWLDLVSNQGHLTGSGSVGHPDVPLRQFWPDATLNLALVVEEGDWAFLDQFEIPALDRLAGQYTANLLVKGTTREPLISGEISSSPFNVHWLHLERLSSRILLDSEQLVLADLEGNQGDMTATGRIEVPIAFDLLSTPVTPDDGPFLMHLVVPPDSDLSGLTHATNAFIEFSGRGGGDVTIAGPLAHPLYQGQIQVRQANFVIKRMEEIYREVDADGVWSGDVLTMTRIEGQEGARGTISGNGSVTFNGLELETFDIQLDVDRFLVASIPDLRVLVRSQDARLQGVKVGPDSLIVPKFSGNLEVIQARYTGDFSEKSGVGDPLGATVAPDWLADIQLYGSPRSSRILNRAMELYMSGDATVIRDLEGIYLRGSMDIDAGRLPVFNNDFKVVHGRLDFSQEVGIVPRVDMEAETRIRIQNVEFGGSALERITVHVTGTLDEPVVNYTSESGYTREGIERMLLGLSPYAGDPQTTGGLRSATIAAGFNLLEREIAAELNIVDTFDIQQIDRNRADGRTNVTPLFGVGKYLSEELYIKYAQGLSDADRDLLVEYQITKHLLLQSEIRQRVDEQQGDMTYSLDLKYRFEY